MICSMTGFGSGRAEASNLTVLVEIKSVNHRYIDTHIKIPGEFQGFENRIRHKISSSFKRGRFDVFVRIDFKRESFRLETNQGMIRAYTDLMERLKTDPHSPNEFRARGPLQNLPEFYKAFSVNPGDGMFLAPEQRVKLW